MSNIPLHIIPHLAVGLDVLTTLPQQVQDSLINSARIASYMHRLVQVYSYVSHLDELTSIASGYVDQIQDLLSEHDELVSSMSPEQIQYQAHMHIYLRHSHETLLHTSMVHDYNVHETEIESYTFQDPSSSTWHTYQGNSLTIEFDEQLLFDSNMSNDILTIIQDQETHLLENNLYTYQIVLSGLDESQTFFNTTPSSIIRDLELINESYADDFGVKTITLNNVVRNPNNAELANITAGTGEGIPTNIPGTKLWLVDVFKTRSNCVLYAYHLWASYSTTGNIVDYVQYSGSNKDLLDTYRTKMREHNVHGLDGMYSIKDIQSVYPHEYMVVSNIAEFVNSHPNLAQTTVDKCCYYYDCGHVCIIMHEDVFKSPDNVKLLKRKSKKHVLALCKAKSVLGIQQPYIVTLDIESYRDVKQGSMTIKHIPLLVGLYIGLDSPEYYDFKGEDCIVKALRFIRKYTWPTDNVVIWIHNGGGYDTHLMFDDILKCALPYGREPVKVTDVNGSLITVSFFIRHGLRITFKDSYRLLPSSLDRLARDYGVDGKLPNVDICNVSRHDLLKKKLYRQYLKQDCVALHSILKTYQSSVLQAGYSDPLRFSTQSSFVKNMFYSKCYDSDKYPIYSLPKWLHEWIYDAYKGGRNEMFYQGVLKGDLYVYDFTSMYPHVGTFELPYGVPKHVTLLDIRLKGTSGIKTMSKWFGFVRCTVIYSPIEKLPYLGFYKDHCYMFDHVINASVTITTLELKRCLELGYEVIVHEQVTYQSARFLEPMFTDLFNKKQHARSNGDIAMEKTAKLAAVSGYGFFGFNKYGRQVTRVYNKDLLEEIVYKHLNGNCTYRIHKSGHILVSEKVHMLSDDTNIAIAAFITAYARDRLYTLMTDIMERGYHVYYCDTDSVFTNMCIEKDHDLKTKWMGTGMGQGLGELKREYVDQDIKGIVLAALKVYAIKTRSRDSNEKLYHIRIKGININNSSNTLQGLLSKETKKLTIKRVYKELMCSLRSKSMAYSFRTYAKYTTTIVKSRNNKIKSGINLVERIQRKKLTLRYNKGIVSKDGTIYSRSGKYKAITT